MDSELRLNVFIATMIGTAMILNNPALLLEDNEKMEAMLLSETAKALGVPESEAETREKFSQAERITALRNAAKRMIEILPVE